MKLNRNLSRAFLARYLKTYVIWYMYMAMQFCFVFLNQPTQRLQVHTRATFMHREFRLRRTVSACTPALLLIYDVLLFPRITY